VKPATHVHWYAVKNTAASDNDSLHVAPFLHGLLLHSLSSKHTYSVMFGRGILVPFVFNVIVPLQTLPFGHELIPHSDSAHGLPVPLLTLPGAVSPFGSKPQGLLTHSSTS